MITYRDGNDFDLDELIGSPAKILVAVPAGAEYDPRIGFQHLSRAWMLKAGEYVL